MLWKIIHHLLRKSNSGGNKNDRKEWIKQYKWKTIWIDYHPIQVEALFEGPIKISPFFWKGWMEKNKANWWILMETKTLLYHLQRFSSLGPTLWNPYLSEFDFQYLFQANRYFQFNTSSYDDLISQIPQRICFIHIA